MKGLADKVDIVAAISLTRKWGAYGVLCPTPASTAIEHMLVLPVTSEGSSVHNCLVVSV